MGLEYYNDNDWILLWYRNIRDDMNDQISFNPETKIETYESIDFGRWKR